MKLKFRFRTEIIENRPFHLVLFSLATSVFTEFFFQHFNSASTFSETVGRVLLIFLSIYFIQSFAALTFQHYKPKFRDLFLLHGTLIFSALTLFIGRVFTLALGGYLQDKFTFFHNLNTESLYFLIPFGVGGLIVQSVRGGNYCLIFSLCFALLIGFYLPPTALLLPYFLITTLVASYSIMNLRSRSDYLRAGVRIGMIAVVFSLAGFVISNKQDSFNLMVSILCSIFGGYITVFFAAGLTPFLEYLGGYVTNLRLMEMSMLDNPLLKNLSIQAPGTWNHSMVVGMMVEAAADAADANPVLARVGAYFHDIGKVNKPLYFVENQFGGENKHDKLSPSMSALIIKSHVKDGIEMAREHKVPQAIIDLIEQHHGTSMIDYFYERAVEDAKEAGDETEVDESIFTYPGPKPQSTEAGILMLADVIEASSRSLPDFTPDRIQMHVQKTINRVFASGQLDECDLNLQSLHAIAKSFIRVLNSIYHQRIAYEEEEGKKRTSKGVSPESRQKVESTAKASEKESAGADTENQGNDKENIKRLGMEFDT
jgi:putative nucleotidyltransferase with HDIG domain